MAFIKFNKSSTKAAATSTAAKTDNVVYFPTDEKAIYLNGQKYGENLGLTQTPAQVQTLLDKVEGGIPYIHCSTDKSVADKVLPADTKIVEGGLIAVGFYYGNTVGECNLVVGTSKWRIQYEDGSWWDTPNFRPGAIVTLLIKGSVAYVVSGVMQNIDNVPQRNSTNLISSGGVYDYFVPKLIIPLNNYVDIIYEEDIKSQIINMNGYSGIVNAWRGLIGRGASPQIVIDIEDGEHTFYINSVVVDNPWYPNEDDGSDFITLSFYLKDRYVSLEFYVPDDDPGGGSGS